MKSVIEHCGTAYIMSPEQAVEILSLVLKYGTEKWVSSYEKDSNGKYVNTYYVEPLNLVADVRLVDIKLIPDEAYGVAKMRYQTKESK